jgi:hypothetical protein
MFYCVSFHLRDVRLVGQTMATPASQTVAGIIAPGNYNLVGQTMATPASQTVAGIITPGNYKAAGSKHGLLDLVFLRTPKKYPSYCPFNYQEYNG